MKQKHYLEQTRIQTAAYLINQLHQTLLSRNDEIDFDIDFMNKQFLLHNRIYTTQDLCDNIRNRLFLLKQHTRLIHHISAVLDK